jgi:cytochrome c oxidase assembly protein subunit 15
MVLVGGVTRLTGSGLSITEWNVLMGAVPPLNEDEWQITFAKYQQTPQYLKENYHFTLEEFKSIFWWEYIHRLLGRIIGLEFLIPFIFFLVKKWLPKSLIPKLLVIFFLGGLQGFIGWYMVQSGLVDNPNVSHFRLALHLVTAFLTLGFTLWVALDLIYPEKKINPSAIKEPLIFFGLVLIQIIYGAFVAGLKAGFIYTTFPLMDGYLFPPGLTAMSSLFQNLTYNLTTVQFIHRLLGWIIFLGITAYWLKIRKSDLENLYYFNFVLFAVWLQFGLGILTILNFYEEPVFWGVIHQTGAVILFTATILWLHRSLYSGIESEAFAGGRKEEVAIK